MRRLTGPELDFVELLIAEIEDTITDMTRVLGDDEPAVHDMHCARDWLRGVRDTGVITVAGQETGQ